MPAVVGKRKMASAARMSPFCLASPVAIQADYVRFAQLKIGGTVKTLSNYTLHPHLPVFTVW